MTKKKISKAYFKKFCASFKDWQAKFGLTQYDVSFFHEFLEEHIAVIQIDETNKIANVTLTTELEGKDVVCDSGPQDHAKHETIHLLLNRLRWLGESRYIERSDLDEEWEALVRRLGKVL